MDLESLAKVSSRLYGIPRIPLWTRKTAASLIVINVIGLRKPKMSSYFLPCDNRSSKKLVEQHVNKMTTQGNMSLPGERSLPA